jgi:predicted amino acid-binding ACT domain protein
MNILNHFKLIGVATLLVVGLAACDKPGPAESAGKKIDQSINEAGRKMDRAADRAADKLDQQKEQANVGFDDVGITTRVKAAIFAEPGLKTLQISVDTIRGVVTLSGSVDTQHNRDTARALAAAVDGVHEVDNRLMIKPKI